jgi:glycine oxidase
MASQRYIVVGAGLAGCLIAWRLEQAGHNVLLIGSTQLPSASAVAGGIINPVTGRWMTKSRKFDDCIGHATDTYRELEKQFGINCYHPMPFVRYCQNEADIKRIQRRMRNPRYANVLGNYIPVNESQSTLIDTHGSFQIKQAAHVELPLLLQTLRDHFAKKGIFLDEIFAHDNLKKEDSDWRYKDLNADHIIFCEGTGMRKNPWFNQLPLTPIKGETLIFQCPTLQLPRTIYHRGKWLLPDAKNHFRIGATYDDHDLSEMPTETGKQEILASVQSFIAPQHDMEIKQHTAGLRPCTKDFFPLIGSHPTLSGIHVFNGLGSKGTLLAPEMIRQFLAYLLEGVPLDSEIDCKRHFK